VLGDEEMEDEYYEEQDSVTFTKKTSAKKKED
jgi:hypothetical protein